MPYILDHRIPVKVSKEKWEEWRSEPKRAVLKTNLIKDKFIQTVFLGFDEDYLYETVIMDDVHYPLIIYYRQHYKYYSDALSQHRDLTTNLLNGTYTLRPMARTKKTTADKPI